MSFGASFGVKELRRLRSSVQVCSISSYSLVRPFSFVCRGVRIMPILTESMAPVVTSCNQAFRSCSRSREPDGEAPPSKRVCSSGGRVCLEVIEKLEVEKGGPSVEGIAELDVFGPGTPTKNDEPLEPVRKLVGGWGTLELCLLERVTRSLSTSDLCRLSQVLHFFGGSVGRNFTPQFF